jgi:uncharacterized cofD-like protein
MKPLEPKKKIVCIGGGTGTFVTLKGLKAHQYQLSAIVTMSDSGGSNKRIRDEFGLLPTSDVRQCLVALSDENGGAGLLRKLFMYRFDKGEGISGMTFGNLFMAALSDIVGSQEEGIKQTGKVLRIRGTVIPVSFTDTNLYATYENGDEVEGEHLIDEPEHDGTLKISNIYLKPAAVANPEALKAIQNADLIVLGPGDLYTSLIPNLLVDGIGEAIKASKAKKVYVMNLMTKFGQTYGFKASDHIHALERYIGQSLHYVIVNSGSLNKEAVSVYAKSNEFIVENDLTLPSYFNVVISNVAGSQIVVKDKSDALVRSLIRHDSDRLASTLIQILDSTV